MSVKCFEKRVVSRIGAIQHFTKFMRAWAIFKHSENLSRDCSILVLQQFAIKKITCIHVHCDKDSWKEIRSNSFYQSTYSPSLIHCCGGRLCFAPPMMECYRDSFRSSLKWMKTSFPLCDTILSKLLAIQRYNLGTTAQIMKPTRVVIG